MNPAWKLTGRNLQCETARQPRGILLAESRSYDNYVDVVSATSAVDEQFNGESSLNQGHRSPSVFMPVGRLHHTLLSIATGYYL